MTVYMTRNEKYRRLFFRKEKMKNTRPGSNARLRMVAKGFPDYSPGRLWMKPFLTGLPAEQNEVQDKEQRPEAGAEGLGEPG